MPLALMIRSRSARGLAWKLATFFLFAAAIRSSCLMTSSLLAYEPATMGLRLCVSDVNLLAIYQHAFEDAGLDIHVLKSETVQPDHL